VVHEKYLDWDQGVYLTNIEQWEAPVSAALLRGKVSFIPEGKNYWAYMQGSITRLSRKDYETIMSEHRQQVQRRVN